MALDSTAMDVSQQLDMSPEKLANESNLQEALNEFSEIMDEVEEDGLQPPSKIAFRNAKRLLLDMYKFSPQRYFVYPSPYGRIAITAQSKTKGRVTLLCDSQSGVVCFVTTKEQSKYKSYANADLLLDKLVHDALEKLVQ